MVKPMRRGFTPGKTEKYTMENGATVLSRAMVFGVGSMRSNHTSGNGSITKQRDMAYMFGRMGTNSRVNGSKT